MTPQLCRLTDRHIVREVLSVTGNLCAEHRLSTFLANDSSALLSIFIYIYERMPPIFIQSEVLHVCFAMSYTNQQEVYSNASVLPSSEIWRQVHHLTVERIHEEYNPVYTG